jgi:hypothetical protein
VNTRRGGRREGRRDGKSRSCASGCAGTDLAMGVSDAAIEPHTSNGECHEHFSTSFHRGRQDAHQGHGLITYGHALIAALTGNVHVPNPNPSIPTLTGLLATYETTETATKTGTKGTVGARNAAKAALKSGIRAVVACVQQAADADPENAEAIITSTSFSVRKVTARVKAPFAVKQGEVSGTAILEVKSAGTHASYDWGMSVDGGKTWTELVSTTRTKTTVTALPVGTTVQFRFRSLTPKGQSDWSQPIGLLVK